MSKFLSDAKIQSFDTRVKTAYEASGKLRGTVEIASGIVGATHRFPKMGKGMATKRTPQTDVVPMNITHGNATAVLEDWNAPEYTDLFDKAKVNFSEQDKLAAIIANAIGRREDQLILDALDASSTALVVGTGVGGASTGLNSSKLRRAAALLNAKGVPREKGNRTSVISATGLEQLLGETNVTSSDFNVVKALYDGEVSHWLGFEIIMIEDRQEGGLPLNATVRTNYCYARDAVGLAVGIDKLTEVNYIPHKTSWLANGMYSAGAVGIDAEGIVEIETTEA